MGVDVALAVTPTQNLVLQLGYFCYFGPELIEYVIGSLQLQLRLDLFSCFDHTALIVTDVATNWDVIGNPQLSKAHEKFCGFS